MNFVRHSVTRIEENDRLKKIELCGRLAYKSEDKISESSSFKFVNNIVKSKHHSVLEHGSIILKVNWFHYLKLKTIRSNYLNFSHVKGRYLVSANVRAWMDIITKDPKKRNWIAETILFHDGSCIPFFCDIEGVDWMHPEPVTNSNVINESELLVGEEEYAHKRISYRFITNRAISHMIVRHRVMSVIMESQRYCNYSKGKFNSTITYCIPHWCKSIKEGTAAVGFKYIPKEDILISALQNAEETYFKLLEIGEKAEDARDVLPNATKTEIIVTGNVNQWEHFLSLRTPNSAHPEIRALAKQIKLL
jgi:thymidylate synthase (FAD)